MTRKRIIFSLFALLMLFSCKKKDVAAVDMHYDYFPLQQGTYQVYDVIERNYLSNGQVVEYLYQLKTVIGDTFIDNGGRVNHEFKRYKRLTESDDWSLADLWTTYRNGTALELVEENERMVKLIFPISKTTKWNANAYNTLAAQNCLYKDIFESKSFNGLQFPTTVTVQQEDEHNLIMYRKKYEVYAKGVGLVKKHYQHYSISYFDTTQIETGKDLYYTLVSHGIQ